MKHRFCMFFPLALAIVYLFLCLLNINGSVWFDESYSAYLIRGNFSDIWNLTAMDVHPPLFYFLLKLWSLVFGNADFALRFMSVFFGAISIILAFHLIKRWFGAKAATIGSLLLTFSPMLIRYGQEMRMYTLVLAIILAATYLLDLALESNKKRYWILYAILVSLGMWTHYFTVFAWLTHLFYLKFILHRKIFKKPIFTSYLLSVILYIPWIPFFIQQFTHVQGNFWIESISTITPTDFLTEALFFSQASQATNWLVPLFLSVLILAIFIIIQVYKKLKIKDKKHFSLLIILSLLPPALLILVSLPPLSPMFYNRYLLYSAASIWLLIGTSIPLCLHFCSTKGPVFASVSLSVLMVISSTIGIVNVATRTPKSYMKPTLSLLKQISDQKNEPILVGDIWTYYDAIPYSTEEHPIYTADEWISYYYGSEQPVKQYQYNIIKDLSDFIKEHDRFWYIVDLDGNSAEVDANDSNAQTCKTTKSTSELEKSPLPGYRLINEASDGHYLSLEFEKE